MKRKIVVWAACCWLGVSWLSARTILFTEHDMVGTAVISAEAPDLSWAGTSSGGGVYTTQHISLHSGSALLIRFPIESIPKGYRIVRAELVIPIRQVHGSKDPLLLIRRMLGHWGTGVNYEYRQRIPEKLKWELPGARGGLQDRSSVPSLAAIVTDKPSPHASAAYATFVVTQDVEMWYAGTVPNHGWSLSVEESGVSMDLVTCWVSGQLRNRNQWELIITYEPARPVRVPRS